MAKKKKSMKQVKFLLSKGSPLESSEKNKLKKELHNKEVSIKKGKKKK